MNTMEKNSLEGYKQKAGCVPFFLLFKLCKIYPAWDQKVHCFFFKQFRFDPLHMNVKSPLKVSSPAVQRGWGNSINEYPISEKDQLKLTPTAFWLSYWEIQLDRNKRFIVVKLASTPREKNN